MFSEIFATSSSSILMLPDVEGIRVEIIFIKTDLPLPEPPKITTDSPLLTLRSIPYKTSLVPKFFLIS